MIKLTSPSLSKIMTHFTEVFYAHSTMKENIYVLGHSAAIEKFKEICNQEECNVSCSEEMVDVEKVGRFILEVDDRGPENNLLFILTNVQNTALGITFVDGE